MDDVLLAELRAARSELQAATGKITELEARLAQYPDAHAQLMAELQGVDISAMVAQQVEGMRSSMPLAPNLLADTKYWSTLCGGEVGVQKELFEAHGGDFSAFWHSGGHGHGTITVVNNAQLADYGADCDGDLGLVSYGPGGTRPWYGDGFRTVIFDVTIDTKTADYDTPHWYCLCQGCPTYTAWNRSTKAPLVQASAFAKVIEHSGDIVFSAHSNMPPTVRFSGADVGAGWIYRRAVRSGFGGCHQPRFSGLGRMKVALALPYIGMGDHGDEIWTYAGSLGRYTHQDRPSYKVDF